MGGGGRKMKKSKRDVIALNALSSWSEYHTFPTAWDLSDVSDCGWRGQDLYLAARASASEFESGASSSASADCRDQTSSPSS